MPIFFLMNVHLWMVQSDYYVVWMPSVQSLTTSRSTRVLRARKIQKHLESEIISILDREMEVVDCGGEKSQFYD